MRSLFYDELNHDEMAAVRAYFDANAVRSGIEGLYWIFLPAELWNDEQRALHQGESGEAVYHLAVETGVDWLRFELLVRGQSVENLGASQADERQTLFILRWAHEMARKLNLRTCL